MKRVSNGLGTRIPLGDQPRMLRRGFLFRFRWFAPVGVAAACLLIAVASLGEGFARPEAPVAAANEPAMSVSHAPAINTKPAALPVPDRPVAGVFDLFSPSVPSLSGAPLAQAGFIAMPLNVPSRISMPGSGGDNQRLAMDDNPAFAASLAPDLSQSAGRLAFPGAAAHWQLGSVLPADPQRPSLVSSWQPQGLPTELWSTLTLAQLPAAKPGAALPGAEAFLATGVNTQRAGSLAAQWAFLPPLQRASGKEAPAGAAPVIALVAPAQPILPVEDASQRITIKMAPEPPPAPEQAPEPSPGRFILLPGPGTGGLVEVLFENNNAAQNYIHTNALDPSTISLVLELPDSGTWDPATGFIFLPRATPLVSSGPDMATVPEPATLSLLACAALGLFGRRRAGARKR